MAAPSSKTLADFCKRSGSSLFSGNHDDVAFLLELFLELSSGQLCPWRLWSSTSSKNPAGSGRLGRDSPPACVPSAASLATRTRAAPSLPEPPPWPRSPGALGPSCRGREAFASGWRSGHNGLPLNRAGDAAFDVLPFTIVTVDFLRFQCKRGGEGSSASCLRPTPAPASAKNRPFLLNRSPLVVFLCWVQRHCPPLLFPS